MNPTYTGTDSDVICDSELPYTYGDSTFTAAGTKDVVFSTINGCDSIITFTLDVNPTYTGTDSDVICDSELPYTYGDSTFTAAGTKDVVFSTINGCDSIITFTLDVNPTYTGTDSDVICAANCLILTATAHLLLQVQKMWCSQPSTVATALLLSHWM